MTTVTVLVGAPGAGKTTWLAAHRTDEYVADTHPVRTQSDLDVDAYMAAMRQQTVHRIAQGQPVIIDATNTYRQHRLLWLAAARRAGATSRAVLFDTPLPLLIAAQRKRAHPAPDRIVIKHHRLMRTALATVPTEGWDTVEVVTRARPAQPRTPTDRL